MQWTNLLLILIMLALLVNFYLVQDNQKILIRQCNEISRKLDKH